MGQGERGRGPDVTIPMAAFCLFTKTNLRAPMTGFLFSPRSFFLRLIRKVFGRSLDTMDTPSVFYRGKKKTAFVIAE